MNELVADAWTWTLFFYRNSHLNSPWLGGAHWTAVVVAIRAANVQDATCEFVLLRLCEFIMLLAVRPMLVERLPWHCDLFH